MTNQKNKYQICEKIYMTNYNLRTELKIKRKKDKHVL